MKKTYKNRLPKNMEASSINAKVVDGEIIVEVEMKERFHPKDGDFCVTKNGCIFIFNSNYKYSDILGYYVGIDGAGRITINRTNREGFGGVERLARESEKNTLLERLENEFHKRWNPETKELEDIRWRAEKHSTYYTAVIGGYVEEKNEINSAIDNLNYKMNNYFRTPEAAQKVADQIKEIFKNSKAE